MKHTTNTPYKTPLDEWIESESIQQEITLVLGTQSSAILAAFAFFALLWTHKPGGFKHEVQHGLKTDETPREGF